MQYQISHSTTYDFSQPVTLKPHIIRLQPRSDSWQTVASFQIGIIPQPANVSRSIDLDGNNTIKIWFDPDRTTKQLSIQIQSQVETHCTNPFDYLLEDWATFLPIDYPSSLQSQLYPYLAGKWGRWGLDSLAIDLGEEIAEKTSNNVFDFLIELNQRIYDRCDKIIRETGEPLPPKMTWEQQAGSCRDLAILFMEICRSVGLATRFVSGYHEGDISNPHADLHAWVEVYLPGAGWRGYDPLYGLAVSDRHVALAASAIPKATAPVEGKTSVNGGNSHLSYQVSVCRVGGG
ncbi:transglutaminase family protein [Merismopedia glauca]|uniref:Transglutaminase n=1 Tax=Merismopedia glauca CCAP 1448/3 TaxID=1296344 RepID=A0A2T1C9Z7_9CYAN|nr:transglutaminase family protein [Merismopedia glauca]PSB05095.1 transglutaminase [Merismopedia glauca CCAP 1448/3]